MGPFAVVAPLGRWALASKLHAQTKLQCVSSHSRALPVHVICVEVRARWCSQGRSSRELAWPHPPHTNTHHHPTGNQNKWATPPQPCYKFRCYIVAWPIGLFVCGASRSARKRRVSVLSACAPCRCFRTHNRKAMKVTNHVSVLERYCATPAGQPHRNATHGRRDRARWLHGDNLKG